MTCAKTKREDGTLVECRGVGVDKAVQGKEVRQGQRGRQNQTLQSSVALSGFTGLYPECNRGLVKAMRHVECDHATRGGKEGQTELCRCGASFSHLRVD
jgi:hypothetical protein